MTTFGDCAVLKHRAVAGKRHEGTSSRGGVQSLWFLTTTNGKSITIVMVAALTGCGAFLSLSDDDEGPSSNIPPAVSPAGEASIDEASGAGGLDGSDGVGSSSDASDRRDGSNLNGVWSCGPVDSVTLGNTAACLADRDQRPCAMNEVKVPRTGDLCAMDDSGGNTVEQNYCEDCVALSYVWSKCKCKKP